MIYTGKMLVAATAKELGLVNNVYEGSELLDEGVNHEKRAFMDKVNDLSCGTIILNKTWRKKHVCLGINPKYFGLY